MFTGENGSVCCFCPDGGIWASGTMVEAAPEKVTALTVGAGAELGKTVASEVASLLRETGRSVALLQVSLFILLVFWRSRFLFLLTYLRLSRRQLQTYFSQQKR